MTYSPPRHSSVLSECRDDCFCLSPHCCLERERERERERGRGGRGGRSRGNIWLVAIIHLTSELTVMESPKAPTTLISAGVNSLTVVYIMQPLKFFFSSVHTTVVQVKKHTICSLCFNICVTVEWLINTCSLYLHKHSNCMISY